MHFIFFLVFFLLIQSYDTWQWHSDVNRLECRRRRHKQIATRSERWFIQIGKNKKEIFRNVVATPKCVSCEKVCHTITIRQTQTVAPARAPVPQSTVGNKRVSPWKLSQFFCCCFIHGKAAGSGVLVHSIDKTRDCEKQKNHVPELDDNK